MLESNVKTYAKMGISTIDLFSEGLKIIFSRVGKRWLS